MKTYLASIETLKIPTGHLRFSNRSFRSAARSRTWPALRSSISREETYGCAPSRDTTSTRRWYSNSWTVSPTLCNLISESWTKKTSRTTLFWSMSCWMVRSGIVELSFRDPRLWIPSKHRPGCSQDVHHSTRCSNSGKPFSGRIDLALRFVMNSRIYAFLRSRSRITPVLFFDLLSLICSFSK